MDGKANIKMESKVKGSKWKFRNVKAKMKPTPNFKGKKYTLVLKIKKSYHQVIVRQILRKFFFIGNE